MVTWEAAIPAGATIVSGLLGYSAAQDAEQRNADIARFNQAQSIADNRLQRMIAERIRQETQLGSTDVYGTRTRFIPGMGWVTEAAPGQQSIADAAQRAQQFDVAGREATRQELAREATDAARSENRLAEEMLRRVRQRDRPDRREVEQELIAQGEAGRNAQARDIARGVNRSLVRQGNTSNVGDIISARAQASEEAARSARAQARSTSRDIVRQEGAEDTARGTQLYQALRNRAEGRPAIPISIPFPQRNDMTVSNQLSFQGTRNEGVPYVQPDYSLANTVGQGATAISQSLLLDRIMRNNERERTRAWELNNQGSF